MPKLLEDEGFTKKDIKNAVKKLNFDWQEKAVKSAESWIKLDKDYESKKIINNIRQKHFRDKSLECF